MILSIVSVILVLAGLIFIHELGHFLMARALGIGVSTFSLGFGPKIWSRTWGKTEYCLSAVPLGGYCALVGEEDAPQEDAPEDDGENKDANERKANNADLPESFAPEFTQEESFALRPAWQRLCVVAAGPAANILLALVICWGLAFSYGKTHALPVIGSVEPTSAAAEAGLQPDDIIVELNGTPINTWQGMASIIAGSEGRLLRFVVDRNRTTKTLDVTARPMATKNVFGEDQTIWVVGIRASGAVAHEDVGFFEAASLGVERTWNMIVVTWTGFVKLFQRSIPMDQVGGPIMIAQMVGQQAAEGLANVLSLAALISINLGILNLLPIPVLDGGHIVFLTLEMIFRRPVSMRVRAVSTQVGFALLICLMVFATYNDIARLLG